MTRRRQAHRPAHRRRAARAAPACSAAHRVAGLVVLHLRDDRARRQVARGQPLEMAVEVALDLALGLDHEAEAGRVAGRPATRPMPKAPAIPERIEQARPGAQLAQALGGPGEMVGLLARPRRSNWRRSAGSGVASAWAL